jgi:Tol biopolymer transport system component
MNKVLLFAVCILACVSLFACATSGPKYVTTSRLEVKQEQTKEGTKEVVVVKEELAETNVIEKSSNVKAVTKITQFAAKGEENLTLGALSICKEGKVVFPVTKSSGKKTVSELWSTANGGAMTKITAGSYRDIDPSFSLDGNFIFFASNRADERPKIWRIKANGLGGLTRVTSGNTFDYWPHASPAGDRIAYASVMEGDPRSQIWTITGSGTLPTQITLGSQPCYSPDGGKIAFVKEDESTGLSHIWVMDADGSNRTQMTQGNASEFTPSWDFSGNYLLFASDAGLDEGGKKNLDIYVMKADGTEKTQLTTNGSVDILPVMDPTGSYIYFVSNRGGDWNAWRMEHLLEMGKK